MLKGLKEKREELRSSGNSGFTLMELIIVIAILAMLIAMLLPRFSNYTDKAMGAAAGVDTKNILTVATAFNLDNNTQITLAQLQEATGLSDTAGASKTLTQAAVGDDFVYTYTRGGATVTAAIDVQRSHIQYTIHGADNTDYNTGNPIGTPPNLTWPVPAPATSDNQANRIAKGLGF